LIIPGAQDFLSKILFSDGDHSVNNCKKIHITLPKLLYNCKHIGREYIRT